MTQHLVFQKITETREQDITEKRGKEKLLMENLTLVLGQRLLSIKPSHELLESYVNVAVNNGIYSDLFRHLMDNGASKELLIEYLSF